MSTEYLNAMSTENTTFILSFRQVLNLQVMWTQIKIITVEYFSNKNNGVKNHYILEKWTWKKNLYFLKNELGRLGYL